MTQLQQKLQGCDGFRRVGRSYRARCPVHNGQSTTSLSIKFDDDRTLLWCHAGCSYADIMQALELSQPALSREPLSRPAPSAVALADVATRDRVYQSLLTHLALSPAHRQDLHLRGLDNTHIERGVYRSLPLRGRSAIAGRLVDQFGPETCGTVPGIIQKPGRGGRRYWTLAGSPGLLIPQRDTAGRIVALLIRPDDPTHGKYLALSSAKYDGPSPGANCHVPRFVPVAPASDIRLTEGILKADFATVLSAVLTLGLPGVSAWRMALPILEQLQPKNILLAWDADWRRNPAVACSLADAAMELTQQGYHVQFEYWCPDKGKGIDDVLSAGHVPERRHWTYALAAKTRGLSGTKAPKGVMCHG
jgi:hypothetical protein